MDDPAPESEAGETPEAAFDRLRDHADWPEAKREGVLARVVEQFPPERIRQAVLDRLGNLEGGDGESMLRLVEAYASPRLLEALADALLAQPDLEASRSWEALSILEGAGLLEAYPALMERWDELADALEGGDSLEGLVEQLEEEPEGSWVALQGLGAVEPEVRAEILAGLARFPTGPGLVAFLRILTFAHEPTTRAAALDALAGRAEDDPEHLRAWAEVAHDHPDRSVRDRATRRLEGRAETEIARALADPRRARPVRVGSLVTALDGEGRGSIAISSRDRGRWVVASFVCDVWKGVVDMFGQVGDDPATISALFEELAGAQGRDAVEDAPELADGLLAGSLMLCGSATNPVLRYWLERTVGPEFLPRPFVGLFGDPDLAEHALEGLAEATHAILDACPDWVDVSPLTFDLAEEVALRSGASGPDPRRDAGAYRYLFEHRLLDRLEHYRRMLLWMASFWHATGQAELARPALALAWQLSDAQHAVPSHPFTVELTTRSLKAAQGRLARGDDPRKR